MCPLPPLAKPLLDWYDQNARTLPWRSAPSPYAVWVSEIMLQQTRVEAVQGYFTRFLQALPAIADLAAVEEQALLKLWEGLGYYSRARNLQKAARLVMQEYGGALPASFQQLKSLPGIGDYTAGAIASIAFGLAVPAVDGNVLRVMTRLLADDRDVTRPAVRRDYFERIEALLQPLTRCGDFNQALMDLGATVCLPNGAPRCESCPLSRFCLAFEQGCATAFPVKPTKKPRKIEKRTVFLLERKERVALRQREASGLLAGLWEFPQVEGTLTKQAALAQLESWGICAEKIKKGIRHKHIFTHIEWHMSSYLVQCGEQTAQETPFVWVSEQERKTTYPLPSAFQPFAAQLHKPF